MRWVGILSTAALVLTAAVAQEKPNFSGVGAQRPAKRFRQGPPPQDRQVVIVIDHKEPSVKLTRTTKGDAIPGGEATNEWQYTTDGKERTNMIEGLEEIVSRRRYSVMLCER
jgi:hypothetical protein